MSSRELENAIDKVTISHELMAYQFNQYLNKNDSGYMVCINPEWENELNLIKQSLTDKDNRIKELEEEAKCNLKLANDWSDKATKHQSKLDKIEEECNKVLIEDFKTIELSIRELAILIKSIMESE